MESAFKQSNLSRLTVMVESVSAFLFSAALFPLLPVGAKLGPLTTAREIFQEVGQRGDLTIIPK